MSSTPQMPATNDPADSIDFAFKMSQKWKADMAPGEKAYTVVARIEDTFTADPILAMFVPVMRNGFIAALTYALTAPTPSPDVWTPEHNRTVTSNMNSMTLEVKACEVFDTSPLSVLSDKARKHLISTLIDGLYPHATIAARTS